MLQATVVENIKTHILRLITSSQISWRLQDNVGKKYGRTREATDNITRMRFTCCIREAIDTHSVYVIYTVFPRKK